MSSVNYDKTDAQQHGICLLHICHSLVWRSVQENTVPELYNMAKLKGTLAESHSQDRWDFQSVVGWWDLRFSVVKTVLHDFLI